MKRLRVIRPRSWEAMSASAREKPGVHLALLSWGVSGELEARCIGRAVHLPLLQRGGSSGACLHWRVPDGMLLRGSARVMLTGPWEGRPGTIRRVQVEHALAAAS